MTSGAPTPIRPVDDTEILSLREVADYLGVSYATVLRRVQDGSLMSVKRGNRRFVRRRWLDDFLDSGEVPA